MNYYKLLGLTICCALGLGTQLNAQSGFVATGGEVSGTSGSYSASVGQVDYKFTEGTGGSFSSGIQQAYTIEDITSDISSQDIDGAVSIFPNPTSDRLQLKLSQIEPNYAVELYDNQGKLVYQAPINNLTTEISVKHLSDAYYILRLTDNGNELKSFKIIKH